MFFLPPFPPKGLPCTQKYGIRRIPMFIVKIVKYTFDPVGVVPF